MKRLYAVVVISLVFSMNTGCGPKEDYQSYWFKFKMPWSEENFITLVKKIIPMGMPEFKQYAHSISLLDSKPKILALLRVMDIKPSEFSWSGLKDERSKRFFLSNALLKRFPDVNKYIVFLLSRAYKDTDRKLVKLLRSRGVDISLALSDVLDKEWFDIVPQLIKDGAVPDDELTFRITSSRNNEKFRFVLPQLLRALRNVNQRYAGGRTLLFYVTGGPFNENDKKVIQILLKAGLDINAQDDYGNTKLLLLVQSAGKTQDDLDEILFFVKHGANPKIKNLQGKSALDIAKGKKRSDIVAILESSQQ